MSLKNKVIGWQQQKVVSTALFIVTVILLTACVLGRFVPRINDAVSGKPRYMEAITRAFAKGLVEKTGGEYPVIVSADASRACENMENTPVKDYDDIYYVLAFTEQSHALCFIAYVPADGLTNRTTLLGPRSGQNYGRPMNQTVKVTPISHSLRIFTDEFLSLLDWHKELKPENKTITASRHYFSSAENQTNEDLTLNLYAIRGDVGKRHQAVNRVLLQVVSLGLGVEVALAGLLWMRFRNFRHHCRLLGLDVGLGIFFGHDLESIDEKAQRTRHRLQEEQYELLRAENLRRRTHEETRAKLLWLQSILPNAQQRSRIQECLDHDVLDEMKALADELQTAAGQKTPEERLNLLLESLKPYCTDEEFEICRREALEVLARLGFREARESVVTRHDEFKARAREAEPDEDEWET